MNYFETLSVLIPWLALVIAIYTFFQQRKLQREANDLQRATSELATRQLQMLEQEKLERHKAKLSLVLVGTQGNHTLLLSNTGIADATNVRIESLGPASPLVEHQISSLFPLERLRPSEELRLGAAVYYESPPTFSLRLRWKDSDNSERMEDFIIPH